MRREEIEAELKSVEDGVSALGIALLNVDGMPALKLIDPARLTGISGERLSTVPSQVQQIWEWFSALRRHVDLLRARFDATPTGGRGQAGLDAIAAELREKPVEVPNTRGYAAAALLEHAMTSLTSARQSIDSLDQRWRGVLPLLDAASARAASLRREAEALAEDHVGELSQAEADIARARDRIAADPLTVDATVCEGIDDRLEKAQRYLADVRTRRDTLTARIGEARANIDRLRVAIARAMAARTKAASRVRTAPPAPPTPLSIGAIDDDGGLRQRLDAIAARSSTDWRSVDTSLRALVADIEDLHDQANAVLEASTEVLDRRNELRGRLRAFRAKAHATGRAEEAGLNELYRAANDALVTVPIDLGGAARAVDEYAAAVSGRGARRATTSATSSGTTSGMASGTTSATREGAR